MLCNPRRVTDDDFDTSQKVDLVTYTTKTSLGLEWPALRVHNRSPSNHFYSKIPLLKYVTTNHIVEITLFPVLAQLLIRINRIWACQCSTCYTRVCCSARATLFHTFLHRACMVSKYHRAPKNMYTCPKRGLGHPQRRQQSRSKNLTYPLTP